MRHTSETSRSRAAFRRLQRGVRHTWDVLNVVTAWPFLLLCDVAIAWTGVQTWEEARAYTNAAMRRVWHRYA